MRLRRLSRINIGPEMPMWLSHLMRLSRPRLQPAGRFQGARS